MFNTLPSNARTAATIPEITSLPMQDGGASATGFRQQSMVVYDDDTDAKKQYWGPRFQWASLTSALTSTAWVDMLTLPAPGVLQFLAAWVAGVGSDSSDVRLRVLLDGVEALVLENFRIGTSDSGKGFVLVGDSVLNGTTVNLGGGIAFDNLAFRRECKVQIQAESAAAASNDYKCMYRAYGTN